jgi:hypothetical protein
MVVLGMAFRQLHIALFGTGFDEAWHEHTELAAFAMAFNMTLPMVLVIIATLGAPLEVTAANLAIETFLPADAESAARLRELAESPDQDTAVQD